MRFLLSSRPAHPRPVEQIGPLLAALKAFHAQHRAAMEDSSSFAREVQV
jgi:hypothetical protein